MDITVERNAFGRQADSFESDIHVSVLEDAVTPFPAIFIRAPLIARIGPEVVPCHKLSPGINRGRPLPPLFPVPYENVIYDDSSV
jgi:glutamine amidotransferase PdxT